MRIQKGSLFSPVMFLVEFGKPYGFHTRVIVKNRFNFAYNRRFGWNLRIGPPGSKWVWGKSRTHLKIVND